MKRLLKILAAVVILLIVGMLLLGFFLDSLVKKGVETAGPKIAKVDVKLDSVKLSILWAAARSTG